MISTGRQFTVRALKSGVATLRLKSGKVERIKTVRVAAPEEVVAASVRLPRTVACCDADVDVNLIGEAAPQKITRLATSFTLAWILSDGTFAVGGAGRITSPTPGAEVLVVGGFGTVPHDLELMHFSVGGTGGILCHAGMNRVVASIGAAKLDWTFEQVCQ